MRPWGNAHDVAQPEQVSCLMGKELPNSFDRHSPDSRLVWRALRLGKVLWQRNSITATFVCSLIKGPLGFCPPHREIRDLCRLPGRTRVYLEPCYLLRFLDRLQIP